MAVSPMDVIFAYRDAGTPRLRAKQIVAKACIYLEAAKKVKELEFLSQVYDLLCDPSDETLEYKGEIK